MDDEFSAFSWHHPGSAALELIVFSGCQMASRPLALSLTKYGSAHFEFTRGVKFNLWPLHAQPTTVYWHQNERVNERASASGRPSSRRMLSWRWVDLPRRVSCCRQKGEGIAAVLATPLYPFYPVKEVHPTLNSINPFSSINGFIFPISHYKFAHIT